MCRELLGSQTAEQLKATTPDGDTALHIATRKRDLDMVRILVDYSANVDIQNASHPFILFGYLVGITHIVFQNSLHLIIYQ